MLDDPYYVSSVIGSGNNAGTGGERRPIFINQSNNNTVTNNITSVGANGAAPTVKITSAGGTVSSAVQTITGTVDVADAGSQVTVLDGTGLGYSSYEDIFSDRRATR